MQDTGFPPPPNRRLMLAVAAAALVAGALVGLGGFRLGRTLADQPTPTTTPATAATDSEDPDEGAEEAPIDLPENRAEAQAAYDSPAAGGMIAEVVTWNRTYDVATFDLEGDGDLDLLLTVHNVDDDAVWIQDDGSFTPSGIAFPRLADESRLLVRDRHACDGADVDADGDLDLYCTIGFPPQGAPTGNELWLQGSDGTFTEATPSGAEDPDGRGRFVRFFDLNGDELPDLHLTNHTKEGHGENRVYRNLGGLRFEEVTTDATGEFGSRCTAEAGDWNGDGLDDLVTCPARTDAPTLFENRAGSLEAADNLFGGSPPEDLLGDARLHDLDGDGHLDLILVTDGSVEIRLNDPAQPERRFGTLELRLALDENPRSLDVADLNGDGAADIYITRQGGDCRGARGPNGEDVVLLGPEWEQIAAPYLSLGCSDAVVAVASDAVVVVNSFDNRPGAITLVRKQP